MLAGILRWTGAVCSFQSLALPILFPIEILTSDVSYNAPFRYVAIMNAIFSAQRSMVCVSSFSCFLKAYRFCLFFFFGTLFMSYI